MILGLLKMKNYKVEEAGSIERMNDLVNENSHSWRPLFITPVNKIDPTGTQFDVNRRPMRYFYYLITFESIKAN